MRFEGEQEFCQFSKKKAVKKTVNVKGHKRISFLKFMVRGHFDYNTLLITKRLKAVVKVSGLDIKGDYVKFL